MFTSSTERMITGIVSKILDEPGMRIPEWMEDGTLVYNTGVLFDITMEVYDDRLDYNKREAGKSIRFFYIAFCGNTSVFTASRERLKDSGLGLRHFSEIQPEEWDNIGNHDSCWRDSVRSFLSEQYFAMCEEVNAEARPCDLTNDCQLGLIDPWKEVKMVTASDEEKEPRGYWKKLVKIEVK